MSRTTNKDVRGMFTRATKAAQALGIDVTGWRYHEGSSTNGIGYKLDLTTGSLGTGWGSNHLGSTAREAYNALMYMAIAWEMAYAALDARTNAEALTEGLIREGYASDEIGAESFVHLIRSSVGLPD